MINEAVLSLLLPTSLLPVMDYAAVAIIVVGQKV